MAPIHYNGRAPLMRLARNFLENWKITEKVLKVLN